MVKVVFYLPLKDNDGRDLSREIEDVEANLFVVFGSWTFHGYIKGSYQMASGVAAIDASAWYSVVIDEGQIADIESILRTFKAKTTQEAIYFEIQRDIDMRYI
jgi:hypothetical protein